MPSATHIEAHAHPSSAFKWSRCHCYVLAMLGEDANGREAADDSDAPMTRAQRRAEKRREHEAHKKAKDIDKANDKRVKSAWREEKKADKNKDKAQKKTEKGKTDKAQKKTDKAARRRKRAAERR